MTLTQEQAETIAELLNRRNQLTVPYTTQRVLNEVNNYRYRLSPDGNVIACIEIKKVQWYQVEVLHLTIAEDYERKGHAKSLLREAEDIAKAEQARILQCTIRDDNTASATLFESFGFRRVSSFFNERSGNNVGVYQKILVTARIL